MAGVKGRSGRRKEPAATKKARGTYRSDRDKEPIRLPAGVPPIPKGLHKKAAAEWKRLGPICVKAGLLTEADWLAWSLGFWAYSTWLSASESIGEFVYYTAQDIPVQRPEIGIANQAWKAVMTFCREFGLTASSRSGLTIKTDGETQTDPLEDCLRT